MSHSSPPLIEPPRSPAGKGMLPGVLAGVATMLIAAALLVLSGFAIAAVANLASYIDYARTSALPIAQYDAAQQKASLLAAFSAITGLLSLLAGVGVLLTSIIVWGVKRKKIAQGYSPPVSLRLVLPAAALALAMLFLLTGALWRLATPEASAHWRDAQIARDIEEKRRAMEDATSQRAQADREQTRATMAAQRQRVMARVHILNGDGDEAARQAALNELAGRQLFDAGRGGRAARAPAPVPDLGIVISDPSLQGKMLTAEDKAELRAGMECYAAVLVEPRNTFEIDHFSIYFVPSEWPAVRDVIMAHKYDRLDPNSDEALITAMQIVETNVQDAPALARLLDRGLSPDKARDTTFLTLALRNRQEKLVDILLAHGADPNLSDDYGMPPLCYAVQDSPASLVQRLLEKGAKPDQGVMQGKKSAFDLNLRSGVAIGRTALSMAAVRTDENPQIVQALLDKGADPNLADSTGKTALDYLLLRDKSVRPQGVEAALRAKGAKTGEEIRGGK